MELASKAQEGLALRDYRRSLTDAGPADVYHGQTLSPMPTRRIRETGDSRYW